MSAVPPLQLLLFRHPGDVDVRPYEDAILRAFHGGREIGGYAAVGDDLGIQIEIYGCAPPQTVDEKLAGFCHAVVVVLVDRQMLEQSDAGLWDWLAQCWERCDASDGRHAMIVLPLEERQAGAFTAKRPALLTLQIRPVQELGERSLRPAMIALLALHECRRALASALPALAVAGQPPGFLRLFISHAKMDGLPLALSLRHLIGEIPWLRSFYDATDLPTGTNWVRELERGVSSSLIVMLRTDGYDSRYWCQREVCWSDEYATPAVVVDARAALNHPGATLPFDRIPTVRIPDGNLTRILFLALREGLRYLHFMRRVEEMKRTGDLPVPAELRVFSLAPSMAALLRAARSLALATAGTHRIILYPDPPLRTGQFEAATALVEQCAPGTRLLTPNTLATAGGLP